MEAAEARRRVYVDGRDLLGCLRRHFLDIHAAFGRGDEGHAARGPVHEKRQIEFARDGRILDHIDAAYHAALGAGLWRHQRLAEHPVGLGVHLLDGLHEFDATTLAAAARVDLGLHNEDVAVELLGEFDCLVGAFGDNAVCHRGAVGLEEILGLVLVNIHAKTLRTFLPRRLWSL